MQVVERIAAAMDVAGVSIICGNAIGLSATAAWHRAVVGDDAYVRLISAVARLSFRQNARNLDSTDGAVLQSHAGPRNFVRAAPVGGQKFSALRRPSRRRRF